MRLLNSSFLGSCLLCLQGCTFTIGDVVNYQSTADHVKSVFKHQNSVSTQVMMLSETELSSKDYDKLLAVEAIMQQKCQLLNEYAIKAINHESTSLLFKKQVKDSTEGCDTSINDVESLLEDFDLDD